MLNTCYLRCINFEIMKLLISIISILLISYNPLTHSDNEQAPANQDVINENLTFDGYEGEYYFFTDANYQAVVLEANPDALAVDLINGGYEGKTFEVVYTNKEKNEESSSEGVITQVSLSK